MWRLRRMHALGVFGAAALLVLLVIAISIRVELLGHLYPDAASSPTNPVALVLGAEVYADGRPSPALASRLVTSAILLDAAGERTLASCIQARDSFGAHRRLGIDADGIVAPEFTGDRVRTRLKRERPPAEAEGRSSGGRTGVSP